MHRCRPLAVIPTAMAAVAGGLAAYCGWIRPWHLRWGSRPEEAAADLPGDDLVPQPMLEATRTIDIGAPPTHVWPWIVQMGYGRAGFYSIDLIDNGGRPSANQLLAEFQELAVGDTMPTNPLGGFRVVTMTAPQELAMTFDGENLPGVTVAGVVSMLLQPTGSTGTRLVTRIRANFGSDPASRLYALIFEPGDFIMMRRMLLGLKQRAETTTDAEVAMLTDR